MENEEDTGITCFFAMTPTISSYNPHWPLMFEEERVHLQSEFFRALRGHCTFWFNISARHVVNLPLPNKLYRCSAFSLVLSFRGKPIIDIQVLVHAKAMPPALDRLLKLGYRHRKTEGGGRWRGGGVSFLHQMLMLCSEHEGVPTQEYMRFDKGDPVVTHCLHLRHHVQGSTAWNNANNMRFVVVLLFNMCPCFDHVNV